MVFRSSQPRQQRITACVSRGKLETHRRRSDLSTKPLTKWPCPEILCFGVGGLLVECGVFPSVNDPVVVTDGAFPANRSTLVPGHFQRPSTYPMVRTTPTINRSHPLDTRGTGGGSLNNQTEEFTHPSCRPRHRVGHVQEVAEIRNKHTRTLPRLTL